MIPNNGDGKEMIDDLKSRFDIPEEAEEIKVNITCNEEKTPEHVLLREDFEREITDYLIKKLSIPDNVFEFRVNFAVNEAITVECKYYPKCKEEDGDRTSRAD